MNRACWTIAGVLALGVANVHAAQPQGTRISFQASAQRNAPNDLGSATAYVEISGTVSADVAQRVNAVMTDALTTAKTFEKVTVRTGNSRTWPLYGAKSKTGQTGAIEGWRMRSELQLESRDATALAAAVGQLQTTLSVSDISFAPSPETRRKIEDDTAIDAIKVFREKANRYAAAFKRPYKIRSLTIHSGAVPPTSTFSAMAMASAESAPIPVEAGESRIQVSVEGQIELAETAAK
jgi:predicted secreted protein